MPTRPKRNVGAPARFKDDVYLDERPRDSTKPAFSKLLAQSTVPYDPTLPSVPWKTTSLDQAFLQVATHAPNRSEETNIDGATKEQDFSEQLEFQDYGDLNLATSDFEGEDNNEDYDLGDDRRSTVLAWCSLDPALQLSTYEYVFKFIKDQDGQRAEHTKLKAAEMLSLSHYEMSDIEQQRAFRSANPLSEKFLQDHWWEDERAMVEKHDPLSKSGSGDLAKWQAMNDKYTALTVYISKYRYTNEVAIKLAKTYLKSHGLKPKVVGNWIEGDEEMTMMLVSTDPPKPDSPILLPVSQCPRVLSIAQQLPGLAILNSASQTPQHSATSIDQTPPLMRHTPPTGIKNGKDFARTHDPRITTNRLRSAGSHENQTDLSVAHHSDVELKVNANGKAEIVRKRTSKRRAASELRSNYQEELGPVARVVIRSGEISLDVDTKPTPEVERLLRTGIAAGRRGYATGRTTRLEESTNASSPVPNNRPPRFSDMLLEIDSDHMPAPTSSDFAADETNLQPLSLTSTPPQPDWSPIPSPDSPTSPGPTPIKSTSRVVDETVSSSIKEPDTLLLLWSAEGQLQGQSETDEYPPYPPIPNDPRTNGVEFDPTQENQHDLATPDRNKRGSSAPPPIHLLSSDPSPLIRDDHDSGVGTSRAPSTEPNIAKREKRLALKQSKHKGEHKVIQRKPKSGKGARGGPGSYKTKKKTATELLTAALTSIVEKADASNEAGLTNDAA